MNNARYQAGSEAELPHRVVVKFTRLSIEDETRSDLIARWIEFWCQYHCDGQWRVEEHQTHVEISFENAQDLVHFKLSPEFDLS